MDDPENSGRQKLERFQQQKFLQDVRRAFIAKDFDNQFLLEYWRTLVRDSEGRWAKYHEPHPNYFIGTKPKPLKDDVGDNRLLELNLAVNQRFLDFLSQMKHKKITYEQFLEELVIMHKIRAFLPETAGKIIPAGPMVSMGSHTDIVLDDVLKIAKEYKDPYQAIGEKRLALPGISSQGLPLDLWVRSPEQQLLVYHQYPDTPYYSEYIQEIYRALKEFTEMGQSVPTQSKAEKIAEFHQYGVNVRMFERTNQAFFLGMSNTLLRELGLRGLEGGILDFVGMRIQPENFKKYFVDEVKRVNHGLYY